MTSEQMKNNLISVINTLNTIEIKGRENMNRLLGSIILLEKVVEGINQEDAPAFKIEEAHDEENPAE